MITYKQGKVVLIPFPFTNLTTVKKRPGIIISSDKFNSIHSDVILMAITSQISEKLNKNEYLLSPLEQKACGLPKPSLIKLGKIFTLDTRLIRKTIGRVPEKTFFNIKERFISNVL